MKIVNVIVLIATVVMLSGCTGNTDNMTYLDEQTQVDSLVNVESGQVSFVEKENESADSQEEIAESKESTSDVESLLEEIRNGSSENFYRELYKKQTSVSVVPDIVKQWNRTDVHSSHSAVLDIKSVDETGFVFHLEAFYYYHSGTVEGKAYFVSENCAVFRLEEIETSLPEEKYEYVVFVFKNDGVMVYASGNSAELGLGMNVYVEGSYIEGEPIYTNAGILEETYTEAQLAFLKDKLPADYYDNLIFATEFGGVGVIDEDGKKVVSVMVPTAGQYGYVATIIDEVIISIKFADGTDFTF